MVGILGEVVLARMVILILTVVVSYVLGTVMLRVLIVVDARLLIHVIVVRVTLGIVEVKQVVTVVDSLKIVVPLATIVIVVLIVVMHDWHIFAMAPFNVMRNCFALVVPSMRVRTALLISKDVLLLFDQSQNFNRWFLLNLNLSLCLPHLAFMLILAIPFGRANVLSLTSLGRLPSLLSRPPGGRWFLFLLLNGASMLELLLASGHQPRMLESLVIDHLLLTGRRLG